MNVILYFFIISISFQMNTQKNSEKSSNFHQILIMWIEDEVIRERQNIENIGNY
jgi:hypothetical protein